MSTHDSALVWRKTQRCDTSQCIEVAQLTTGIVLRDSTLPDGLTLSFSKDEWAGFLAGLRAERLGRR